MGVRLQPIVYVTDMAASVGFYGRLLDSLPSMMSEAWSTFDVGGATLALHETHTRTDPGMIELSLVVDGPLEAARERVEDATAIVTQPFGRSFSVADPDGTLIQVNEHS